MLERLTNICHVLIVDGMKVLVANSLRLDDDTFVILPRYNQVNPSLADLFPRFGIVLFKGNKRDNTERQRLK